MQDLADFASDVSAVVGCDAPAIEGLRIFPIPHYFSSSSLHQSVAKRGTGADLIAQSASGSWRAQRPPGSRMPNCAMVRPLWLFGLTPHRRLARKWVSRHHDHDATALVACSPRFCNC